MYCPFCSSKETKVVDSRLVAGGSQIKRRRECTTCGERFSTYEEAIKQANDTYYGLTAYVYTTSKEITEKACVDIKAGTVSVNLSHAMQPCTPFGGYKESGIGRQRGEEGFFEVTQVKSVSVQK